MALREFGLARPYGRGGGSCADTQGPKLPTHPCSRTLQSPAGSEKSPELADFPNPDCLRLLLPYGRKAGNVTFRFLPGPKAGNNPEQQGLLSSLHNTG